MAVQRIVDFDDRHLAGAAERPLRSVRRRQEDEKVIDAIELAVDLLTTGQRDGDGHLTTRRCAGSTAAAGTAADPQVLQVGGIRRPSADAGEIPGGGVAAAAVGLEVGLTRGG